MAPIAKALGCSPARLSIAWLLAKPVVTSVIIGAKRLDQLQDNLAAAELILTQDELRQLDEVSVLPPEYPGWVLPFQGADRLEPIDRWERFRETKSRIDHGRKRCPQIRTAIWPASCRWRQKPQGRSTRAALRSGI
jgi:hypothetical protein